ncbi:unnamed protein product [Parascedosporium putredinis]|uniref:SRR1-like domain-containing protein n=1 Tax=Parascedosporium putredinis TaxID=1442378 RepID=A0A9P1MB07_9PEZI|nr:unnamed protein product [Parascedosporium putredinis]CAI7993702.1 unnamed protein product [Parascedosporium putredinis]
MAESTPKPEALETEWKTMRPRRRRTKQARAKHDGPGGSKAEGEIAAAAGGEVEDDARTMEERLADLERDFRREEEGEGKVAEKKEEPSYPLTQVVCLGLGSFEGLAGGGGWEGKRRAWMQLFAFETLARGVAGELTPAPSEKQEGKQAQGEETPVERPDPSGVRTILQDPVFTSADRRFLAGRGHDVVDDPGAFEALKQVAGEEGAENDTEARGEGSSTLLFGVHLYLPVYKRALEGPLPAVFVGTGWDTWDDINRGEELPALKEMHETYEREDFPEEEVLSTFSSTCIYWRKTNKV